jgi:amino acid adenylation domain-containing protein
LGPDVVVALLAPRGIDFLTSVLAVFKAGGAYLPLDPRHPADRCREILERSGAPIALMSAETAPLLAQVLAAMPSHRRPRLIELEPLLAGQGGEERLPDRTAPDHLAYVIYTSGSTGAPKGAMVTSRGMVNHLWAKIVELDLGPSDVVAQNAPQIFDISVWQLLAALLVGGRVVIFEDAVAQDPARLIAETEAHSVSVLEVVPSVLREILGELEDRDAARPALARLRWLVATGEALPPDLARRWRALYSHVHILNAYGPTECSDDVTHHRVDSVPDPETVGVPLGRPVINTRIYLLDHALRPVAAGLPGELCVSGDGLGRGYLGEPGATAAAFVPDPFASAPGSRLYRTGDLSRRRPDGILEFLGRIDHQVKIRGFRLELGEVEAALARHPAVGDAVVVAREEPSGDRRLVAYWVAAETPAPPASELRAFLAASLPDYALPSGLVELAELPRTATGKIDRRALPAPTPLQAPSDENGFAPAGSPVREILAQAWCELFGLQRVDPRDNFFELGGHSLMITRLLSRIRSLFKVDMPVQTFFQSHTVAELAAAIEAAQAGLEKAEEVPLVPVQRADGLPLSISQERLWLEDSRDPANPLLKIFQTLRLRGRLDVAALEASARTVLGRHEVLRTGFVAVAGRQRLVLADDPVLHLPVLDLEALPAAERERQFQELSVRALEGPFDLARPPLLKAWLLRLSSDDHLMLAVAHRIVGDDWSMGVLIRETGAVYRALAAGRPPALAELPVQYADFAAWQRRRLQGRTLDAHLAYWRKRLPRAAANGFLGGRNASRRGRWASRHAVPLPEALVEALTSLARKERTTLFMVQAAALQTLFHLASQQMTISMGFPILNRRRKETEGLIGNFGNLLGLTSDFSGDPPFREVLARVREETLGAYAHQEVPLSLLVEILQPERDVDRQPFFSVLFLQHEPLVSADLELPDLTVSSALVDRVPAEADLTVELWAFPTEHRNDFLYRPDVLAAKEVETLAWRFRSLLEAVTADPAQRVSALAPA